jgi:hypothetical protein
MKYGDLSAQNKNLIEALELLDSKGRKNRARHKKQFASDPKGGKKAGANCWEFDVDPHTWNAGGFRLVRRQEGSDVTWWWLEHAGDGKSFKKSTQITGIPSFKPVRETPAESNERAQPDHALVQSMDSRMQAAGPVSESEESAVLVNENLKESWDD